MPSLRRHGVYPCGMAGRARVRDRAHRHRRLTGARPTATGRWCPSWCMVPGRSATTYLDLDALRRCLGCLVTRPPRHPRPRLDSFALSEERRQRAREMQADIRESTQSWRTIPSGRVATYGQIAAIEGGSTARMVGYALAALSGSDRSVPWQRVLNRSGALSERRGGGGTARQRRALEAEGVVFDATGRIDFDQVGWDGPDIDWIERHGFQPAPRPRKRRAARPATIANARPVIAALPEAGDPPVRHSCRSRRRLQSLRR